MDHKFSLQTGVRNNQNQELHTPHSAVSSFNISIGCDATLTTPVDSRLLLSRASPNLCSNPDLKLSPTSISPQFSFFTEDDYTPKFTPPMRYKESKFDPLHISTADYPTSPWTCPSPHWGIFGVSAQSFSSTTSDSSPSLLLSPSMLSTGGMSDDSDASQDTTPALISSGYGTVQAPRLANQSPRTMRPVARHEPEPHQQQSFLSHQFASLSRHPYSSVPTLEPVAGAPASPPLKRKQARRKKPMSQAEVQTIFALEGLTDEDRLLVHLKQDPDMKWKDIEQKFRKLTSKECREAALQMKLYRLRLKASKAPKARRARSEVSSTYDRKVDQPGQAQWNSNARDRRYSSEEQWARQNNTISWSGVAAHSPYSPPSCNGLPDERLGSLMSSISNEPMAEISDRSRGIMAGLDIPSRYGQATQQNQQHSLYSHQQQDDECQRQNRGSWGSMK